MKKRAANPDRLPIGRFVAFRLGNFSMAANFMVMGFLTLYCTDTLGMAPAVVGSILMVSKVIDAFGELYCGYVVDNFKPIKGLGKARPFDFLYIGQWGCTVLLFSVPSAFSAPLKVVWVFLMYSLVQSVFQSLIQSANLPLLSRTFANKNVVMKVQSYGGIFGMVLSMSFNMLFPGLVQRFGTDHSGWTKLMVLVAIPMILFGLTRMLVCKEDQVPAHEDKEEKIRIKDALLVLKENKYVWIVMLVNLLIQVAPGMAVGSFYFTWVVGNMSLLGTISMVSILLLPVMIFIPRLIRKFSISAVISVSAALGIAGSLITFAAKANLPLLLTGAVISGLGTMVPPYLTAIMLMDCATYNRYNGRQGMEGTISAVNQFGGNLGQGLGAQIAGIVMSATGYVAAAEVQSAGALMGIRALYGLAPAVIFILLFLTARAFTLEKRIPEMEAELKKRAQANGVLSETA